MSFKDFSILSCQFEGRDSLGNFGRGHYGVHSCEIILNLDQWQEEMSFKVKEHGSQTKTSHNSSS